MRVSTNGTKIETEEAKQQSLLSPAHVSSFSLLWDAFVLEYEVRVEPFTSQFAREMIRELFSRRDPAPTKDDQKKTFLDVGCGTGSACLLALAHADRRLDVAVTDGSPSMIQRAERRIAADYGSGTTSPLLEAVACDGGALPDRWNDTFDYAVANFSVIFFLNPVAGLEEMLRCLVPATGTAAFTAWGDREETPAFGIFPEAAAQVCPELVSSSTPRRIIGSIETLMKLMEDAGFVDVNVVGPLAKTLEVSSPLGYFNRFALTSPPNVKMISKMDDNTKLRFKDRVMHLARLEVDGRMVA